MINENRIAYILIVIFVILFIKINQRMNQHYLQRLERRCFREMKTSFAGKVQTISHSVSGEAYWLDEKIWLKKQIFRPKCQELVKGKVEVGDSIYKPKHTWNFFLYKQANPDSVTFFECDFDCSKYKFLLDSRITYIKQIEADFPVIIKVSVDPDLIFGISFPLLFEYKDNFSNERSLSWITYYYKNIRGGRGGWVSNFRAYQNSSNGLIKIGTRPDIHSEILKGKVEILIYTDHRIDTSLITQTELEPYLVRIKQRGLYKGTDTLSVGTFKEFNERHPELVNVLLKGDSIRFGIMGMGINYRLELDTLVILPIDY